MVATTPLTHERKNRIINARVWESGKYTNDEVLKEMINKRLTLLKKIFKNDIWIENDVWFKNDDDDVLGFSRFTQEHYLKNDIEFLIQTINCM